MRFKRVELSSHNKRQYLLALGVRDLELLMGISKAASESMPILPEYKTDRRRLRKITKGLAEAIEVAKADNDEGMSVPVEERANYLRDREENPLEDITRIEPSIQDNGQTLKLFIDKREPLQEVPVDVVIKDNDTSEAIKCLLELLDKK